MPRSPAADLRLVSGSTDIYLTLRRDPSTGLATFTRTQAEPLNPIINTTGELDYRSVAPAQGVTWDLSDFSKGLGGFIATPGYYYSALHCDTRYPGVVMPGPLNVADLTGIAANEKVIKRITVGADNWIITTTTAYRSVGGTANWTEVGANGTGWTAGNPTDIVAFSDSGTTTVGVAMGASTAFQYTTDSGTNWTASTRAGSSDNANYFCVASRAGTAPKIWYAVNPNLLFSSANLLNGTAVTTESTVGDTTNDEFTSLIEDDTGVLLIGKRRSLYSIDSNGGVRVLAGPYRYYATSIAGAPTGTPTRPANQNFENPQVIEGRVYYPIEDYRILEYDHGVLTEDIEPSAWGAAPDLYLPINAMVAVGRELWVALGSQTSGLLLTTMVPGRAVLKGNLYTAQRSEVYAGRRQPDGSWQWHGSIVSTDFGSSGILRYMWYDDATNYLYLSAAVQQLINVSQRRCFVPLRHPLAAPVGGVVKLYTDAWELETGIYYQQQPNITKTLRHVSGKVRIASGSSLLVAYRVAVEEATTAYATVATWTSQATAETGTAFPAGTTFKGARLLFQSGSGADDDYVLLYNAQVVHQYYPTRYHNVTFTVTGGDGQTNLAGAVNRVSGTKGVRAALDVWLDATEPATVTDVETGETFSMNLDRYEVRGIGKTQQFTIYAREVR